MPKRETSLNVGDKAPAFDLATCQGDSISLEQILKNGPTMLLFFRGTWCPNCRAQVLRLSDDYQEFRKTGTQLIGIFCQKAEPVKKWSAENNIPFPLLVDPDRVIAKEYGVYVSISWDFSLNVARPSNFLVGKDGLIKFVYVSSHQWDRCANDALLAEAKKLA